MRERGKNYEREQTETHTETERVQQRERGREEEREGESVTGKRTYAMVYVGAGGTHTAYV